MSKLKQFDQTVTVTTTLTTVAEIKGLSGESVLNLQITNAGATNALADFSIELKDSPTGEYYTYLAAGTTPTFTTTQSDVTMGLFPFVSGAPLSLAAAATAHVIVNLFSAWAVRLKAKAAANTTPVRVLGSYT